MAQGKLKTKVKLPKGVKKSNNQKKNKPLNLKKGGTVISPLWNITIDVSGRDDSRKFF